MAKKATQKRVETIVHEEASRKYIPTAEYQSVMREEDLHPIQAAYERRNRDLDPQLVWRGKDEANASDLIVHAPPLYIQEKVHPKVLIDDLIRQSKERKPEAVEQIDLFADFNGVPEGNARTEFYQHDANWTNRMILGDSLQIMASLAEREGLRGQVQCIYMDPPYGIKFNSNFQWSTTRRDVTDGKREHITREPEQVKAFRDTWRDGIHSYLTYLRDRLTVARELLAETGSVFVQIGNENVHRMRSLMDEIFGAENHIALIKFKKTSSLGTMFLDDPYDYILWFAKNHQVCKFRRLYLEKETDGLGGGQYKYLMNEQGFFLPKSEAAAGYTKLFRYDNMTSQTGSNTTVFEFQYRGEVFAAKKGGWKTNLTGMQRLAKAGRLLGVGRTLSYIRFFSDFPLVPLDAAWNDTVISGFADPKVYVVQTTPRAIQRCILMSTDPGDLVLDPTCGSGTTAYVAEQWGRRWITIDTSRVALALARARIMGARYPYYILADSPEGQRLEGELRRMEPSTPPTRGDIRQGFVYRRVPHITLKSIANNAEIDVIWERFQDVLEPLRRRLNEVLGTQWAEWQVPGEAQEDWPAEAKELHAKWWEQRIARQREIDASIAAKADYEYLYDRPCVDNSKVRVAGPFTVESLSPHRVLGVDENDEFLGGVSETAEVYGREPSFVQVVLEHLKTAGVQQVHKADRITFTSITPWPGELVCAEGRYIEGDEDAGIARRAGIFVGPEFGTVSRPDLVRAAREAADAGFDVLIVCAFSFDAHSSEFSKLGRIPVLKARMNADLHMANDLKNTGTGNLFVVFGEPDVDIVDAGGGQIKVKIKGVDVFDPQTGEIRSDDPDGIACWFIDTNYNEESFFVRHAYFLGVNDPYKALKTTLRAEIDPNAWATLHSDTSRPFKKPESGRIAVKVINHFGDEVMKVFRVE